MVGITAQLLLLAKGLVAPSQGVFFLLDKEAEEARVRLD